MLRTLLAALALFATPAFAAPFLVSDPVPAVQGAYTINQCAYTRGSTTTFHAVESVTGGVRCNIDLASDAKSGTVTVAFRDSVLGETGPTSNFAFGTIGAPSGLRLIP
jgi:hypothetical protein